MAQWKQIRLGTMRLWVRPLPSISGLRSWHCRELWCRLAATSLIRPPAWEPPCASGAALKRQKKKIIVDLYCVSISAVQQSDPVIHTYTFSFSYYLPLYSYFILFAFTVKKNCFLNFISGLFIASL